MIGNKGNGGELEEEVKVYGRLKKKEGEGEVKVVEEKDMEEIGDGRIGVGAKGSWNGRMK